MRTSLKAMTALSVTAAASGSALAHTGLNAHQQMGFMSGFLHPFTGLDHLAFRLADRAALDAAGAHLDALGIEHGPVKDIGPAYILEFRDPDNIALELTAPK